MPEQPPPESQDRTYLDAVNARPEDLAARIDAARLHLAALEAEYGYMQAEGRRLRGLLLRWSVADEATNGEGAGMHHFDGPTSPERAEE